jgi:hypothetical protein
VGGVGIERQSERGFVFLDSVVIRRFCAIDPELTIAKLNAASGCNINPSGALFIGKRAVNVCRVFNLLHGLDSSTEVP